MPKPEERMELVSQMHEDLGHFGEQRTLAGDLSKVFLEQPNGMRKSGC